ncbi:penicillin-binding protein [Anaplasma marginale]|uniref:peptidoglycan D,D-transpeptidase FtsI family protein n=1 Tax=Anaplasma marginale TaxID=770 RepID=UPI000E571C72|nr:penicillin-binding protein 2 [Anaplasma marginale]AXW84846.1 penicillin-binding protein [Anaplasma marginale]
MDHVGQIFDRCELRNETLNKSKKRLLCATIPFVVFFIIITFRLITLTAVPHEEIKPAVSKNAQPKGRFTILDRNGEILATDIATVSLSADTTVMSNPELVIEKVSAILHDDSERIRGLLSPKKKFIWIKRDITSTEAAKIKEARLKGIHLTQEVKRVYPHNNLLSHILGYVDPDGRGISGIERYADIFGVQGDVKLSVDVRVQNVVREEILRQMEKYSAAAGIGIVMDVRNGEILAAVSLPDFDLNNRSKAENYQKFNRVTLGVYEMGSVFKLFTVASAIDSGKVSVEDTYDVSQPFIIGRYKVNDMYKSRSPVLSVREIFAQSSNVGMAKIAMDLGKDIQLEYFERMDLLSDLGLEIPEVGFPIFPREWGNSTVATASYGYGVAVTPVHVVQAAAGLVNDGIMHDATLIFGKGTEGRRVVSSETSRKVKQLLRFAVERGTGKRANVKGYLVGGKTGSAEKVIDGRYRKDANLASFLGIFPISEPKYAIMVMIDEPKGSKVTGGAVSAPVVGRIISRMAPILSIAPVAG